VYNILRETTFCAWRHVIFFVHSPMSGYCILSGTRLYIRSCLLRELTASLVPSHYVCNGYLSFFFQLTIWTNQEMVLTMLEQTMGVGYICMYEYILSVNILSSILYNQMSLSDLNKYILLKRQQLIPLIYKK
jgi:hypothetical protein